MLGASSVFTAAVGIVFGNLVSLKSIQNRIEELPIVESLAGWAQKNDSPTTLSVKGAAGSLPAFLLCLLNRKAAITTVCIAAENDQAAYLTSDLEQIAGETIPILHLPASGTKPYDAEQIPDTNLAIARADVLQQLATGFEGILVTSLEAVYEKAPEAAIVQQETQTIAVGESISPESLIERLTDQRFKRVEFVEQPGELAVRGGIVDIFPFSGIHPIRVEFFGDEIDSIREFDVHSQRSISRLNASRLVPNLDASLTLTDDASFTSILSYFPEETLVALFDAGGLQEKMDILFEHTEAAYEARIAESTELENIIKPAARYLNASAMEKALLPFKQIFFGAFSPVTEQSVEIHAQPQPAFNSSMVQLRKQLEENHRQKIDTFVLCDNRGQEARLFEILEDEVEQQRIKLSLNSLHEGFVISEIGLAVYTDHQIFNRFHRPSTKRKRKKHGGLSIRELRNLSPGDFVVHIDYGIGKFAGLQHITVRGKQQEAVRILFRGEDVLYVNVNALYKLHKYTGKEGHQPALTKLGSGQWERTKRRTKKRVKDIARDLIKLYARRKSSTGHAFPTDTLWQRELEASFQYEDTPDQYAAAEAVKNDMQQSVPMDRLVCGDVGFGKTEIAVRAAFKTVQDGKQVAILVPTTILASQHTRTFNERLGNYPVRVSELSRFRSSKEQKESLKKLKAGEIDVIIGTHRLLSKDIAFKDLGLLVIDEEQRFGVAAKEKLRALRAEVDTLALTATPIPRTLQFSLMGARDLSIISTPPPNRQPIATEIHTFDKDLIRDAILHEVNRGGQVFFIHNRVQSIDEIAGTIRMLIPNLRVQVGHGQMKASELERVIGAFIDKKYDVLVSTNIVESGIDIANANTIIINQANHFGLADLHQLRGRVGRSDQKAYCYLLVPSIHSLTREAKQRLQAVEEFSDLGSGFSIAMRDLDIRGAGNLLGAEQSGFIADIGYETYHRILDEAVQELRAEEFSDLFADTPPPPASDVLIDVEEDAYIPDSYLDNNVERLNLYRRLSETSNAEEIEEIQSELIDRFGAIPGEVENLLLATRIRNLALPLRLSKVVFKNQRLFLVLPSQETDPFFYEHLFHPLLEKLNELNQRYVLKENKKGTLRAIIQEVPDLVTGHGLMEMLSLETEVV